MKTRIILLLLLSALSAGSFSQVTSAKITYERRTNLYKKFKNNPNVKDWLKEEDKIKTDFFELFITDTFSLFRPVESNLKENYGRMTTKNIVYQDFRSGQLYTIKSMWGEELHLSDSLRVRQWRITAGTRKIAGYECRKALWQPNDSTRIYAWFSYDIVPSTGPESFTGLPGTILGLATEDGGVVYFAKKVELVQPAASILVKPRKKKIYAVPELKSRLTKDYGHEKWFPSFLYEQFELW
jgi:GLPGLI family protein